MNIVSPRENLTLVEKPPICARVKARFSGKESLTWPQHSLGNIQCIMQELGWGDQYYDARGDIFLHAGGINRPPFLIMLVLEGMEMVNLKMKMIGAHTNKLLHQ